jgi:acyl-CoA thioesterase FadM
MSWIETHRGGVPAWQCDTTEHFTIAYYFDRLEESRASLAASLGLETYSNAPTRIEARFVSELRAGAAFHIDSAPLAVESGLLLGHRVTESASGTAVTWFKETPTIAVSAAITAPIADWGGPASEPRGEPLTTDGAVPSGRGRVKRADLDNAGRFGLGAMVHRFSAASGHLGAAIGIDAGHGQENRRGFSTFELILDVSAWLELDAPYQVNTCIAHLGSSSLRMIHTLTDARSGARIARMSQYGVNLDLDARRPARWPDMVRERATPLVVPVAQ